MKSIEYGSTLFLPISLWALVSLIQSNPLQFTNLWRTSESIKIKYKTNKDDKFLIEKALKWFQGENHLFQNHLIAFNMDLKNFKDMEDFKNNVMGKFGLMLKTFHDQKLYMIKFIFNKDAMRIVSKVQKNDVESFRFLEAIIYTILVSIR